MKTLVIAYDAVKMARLAALSETCFPNPTFIVREDWGAQCHLRFDLILICPSPNSPADWPALAQQIRQNSPTSLVVLQWDQALPGMSEAWLESGIDDCLFEMAGSPEFALRLRGLARRVAERTTRLGQGVAAENQWIQNALQVIFDNPLLGVAVLHPQDESVLSCNAALCQWTGYSPEELRGLHLGQVSHPEDWSREKLQWDQLKAGVIDSYECEKRLASKGGGVVWTLSAVRAIRGSGQSIQFILVLLRNHTDFRWAMKQVEGKERFLRDVLEAIPNMVVVKSRRGQVLLANRASADFLGLSSRAIEGSPEGTWHLPVEETAAIKAEEEKVWASLKPSVVAAQPLTDTTGRKRYWQIVQQPLFVEASGEDHLLSVATEVTELTRLAESLEEHQRKLLQEQALLELRVKERTESLNQLNAQLSRWLAIRDRVLAVVNHDIRTPLNVIMGLIPLLPREETTGRDPAYARNLASIEKSSKSLLAALNNLVDLVQIEGGKTTLQMAVFNPHPFLESVGRIATSLSREKGVRLDWAGDPTVSAIEADPRRCRQVLFSLLSVLLRLTRSGGHLRLEMTGDRPQEVVDFILRGHPVELEGTLLARALKDTDLLEEPTEKEMLGFRLELALANRLVKMHGGALWADLEPETGVRFQVSLPWPVAIQNQTVPPPLPSLDEAREDAPETGMATGASILLADDNEANAAMLKQHLVRAGYRVSLAVNGQEACEMVRRIEPDLVLMDLQMPEMDGLLAIQTIRQQPRAKPLPIVVLTALTMDQERIQAMEAGANAFVSKPINFTELYTVMRSCLQPVNEAGEMPASSVRTSQSAPGGAP